MKNKSAAITRAPQDQAEMLEAYIYKVLEAIGYPEAFITDESRVSDFFDWAGKDHLVKVRKASQEWKITKGDPEVRKQNEARLRNMQEKLGVIVSASDYIVDVARRVKELGRG